jgi:hypothetical protein
LAYLIPSVDGDPKPISRMLREAKEGNRSRKAPKTVNMRL